MVFLDMNLSHTCHHQQNAHEKDLRHKSDYNRHPIRCISYWMTRKLDIPQGSQGQQTAAAALIGVAALSSPRYSTCTMLPKISENLLNK
jgi:hypothetical protein